MLVSLHVKNMALIREEEVTFGPGLNILTGETGAGKSIIIGSVNIALGTGSFKEYVPEGEERALVELVFETDRISALNLLKEQDIPCEDGQIVITRKYQNGRTVNRVNQESVTIGFIRTLAGELLDIHGQHQHQSLLYPRYHRLFLDRFAAKELGDWPDRCARAYEEYRNITKEIGNVQMDEAQRRRQIDLLRFQVQEIEDAALRKGEDDQLEKEFRLMSNGQKIMDALRSVQEIFSGDNGADERISRGVRELLGVSDLDEPIGELAGELSQIEDLMNSFGRDLASYIDDFSYDDQEFYRISSRLDLINQLKSKYGRSLEEVLNWQEKANEKLEMLCDLEGHLERLKKRQEKAGQELNECAGQITRIRKAAAAVLEEKIRRALGDLNFADVRFEISFEDREPAADGKDEICFMISTNPGMPLRALQDTASGGELSRIMLALKSVMASEDEIGTLIFDEIDTGISGRTAQKVSEKMALIAGDHQVICITHLAQIAAMADQHYLIVKEVADGQTATHIRELDEEESIEELTRILGGAVITQAVRDSAAEMKQLAREVKKKEGSRS